MDELKPCPFCGGEAQGLFGRDGYEVVCDSCKASVGGANSRSGARDVREAWNARASDASTAALKSLSRDMSEYIDGILNRRYTINVSYGHKLLRAAESLGIEARDA